jgi:hypothetical protein
LEKDTVDPIILDMAIGVILINTVDTMIRGMVETHQDMMEVQMVMVEVLMVMAEVRQVVVEVGEKAI